MKLKIEELWTNVILEVNNWYKDMGILLGTIVGLLLISIIIITTPLWIIWAFNEWSKEWFKEKEE